MTICEMNRKPISPVENDGHIEQILFITPSLKWVCDLKKMIDFGKELID